MATVPGGRAFGVSQFTTTPWTFDEDVERLPALGIATIEIVEDKLDARRWADQMADVADRGLVVSGVQPSVRTVYPSRMMPKPFPVGERIERMRRSIERLAPFARGSAFMVSTGAHPGGNIAETMRATAAALRDLATVADGEGVTLALEPLNPSSMNVESMIWTIDQALEVIAAADAPQVGLCLDLWNVWQNPDIEAQIARASGRILTVQLGGWRTPQSFADRVALGDDGVLWSRLLGAVRQTGYAGAYLLELFHDGIADTPAAGDIAVLIEASRTNFLSYLGG